MRDERVHAPPDRRPQETGVSPVLRMYVYGMQNDGFTFTLQERGRFRVAGKRVSAQQLLVLRGCFHEICELLQAEEKPN